MISSLAALKFLCRQTFSMSHYSSPSGPCFWTRVRFSTFSCIARIAHIFVSVMCCGSAATINVLQEITILFPELEDYYKIYLRICEKTVSIFYKPFLAALQ